MKKLVIVGAGDFGREVEWLVKDINRECETYEIMGFLDDDAAKHGMIISGYKVLGGIEELDKYAANKDIFAVIAMQDCKIRRKIAEAHPAFTNWANIIHPRAVVSDTVKMGHGNILCANVTVSVDTIFKNHCIVNISSVIGHDCEIGDYVSIMSNCSICGHVTVGDDVYIATSVSVVPGRKIGNNSKVSVGSAVITNIKSNVTVMGNPARCIKL